MEPKIQIFSSQSFSSYREFLNDLDLYRRPSSTQKKKDNLPSGDFSEEDSSVSDATSTSVNSGLLSARKRIPRKNAPVPSLAEYFAAHRNGVSARKKYVHRWFTAQPYFRPFSLFQTSRCSWWVHLNNTSKKKLYTEVSQLLFIALPQFVLCFLLLSHLQF